MQFKNDCICDVENTLLCFILMDPFLDNYIHACIDFTCGDFTDALVTNRLH